MKFECNCTNEEEFANMLDAIHKDASGWNFEVGARLWYTPAGWNRTIMIEYQITTDTAKQLVGDDEPDWLEAYEVDDENDYSCSHTIDVDAISQDIQFRDLGAAMLDFAKSIVKEFY